MAPNYSLNCAGFNCNLFGKYLCRRCQVVNYCSQSCQQDCWQTHKGLCKFIRSIPNNYTGVTHDTSKSDKLWRESNLESIPSEQSFYDPPISCSYLNEYWRDKEFVVNDKVVVKASFLPPALKDMIRTGLKNKIITWSYLSSDDFLPLAAHPKVPVDALLRLVENELLSSSGAAKPDMCHLLETASDDFWRQRAIKGEGSASSPLFSAAVVKMLYRNNVRLPIKGRETNLDELRVYSHATVDNCQCYHCLVEPFMDAKIAELWGGAIASLLEIDAASKGAVVTWDEWKTHIQQVFDAYLWAIDVTPSGQFLKWDFAPEAMCVAELGDEEEEAFLFSGRRMDSTADDCEGEDCGIVVKETFLTPREVDYQVAVLLTAHLTDNRALSEQELRAFQRAVARSRLCMRFAPDPQMEDGEQGSEREERNDVEVEVEVANNATTTAPAMDCDFVQVADDTAVASTDSIVVDIIGKAGETSEEAAMECSFSENPGHFVTDRVAGPVTDPIAVAFAGEEKSQTAESVDPLEEATSLSQESGWSGVFTPRTYDECFYYALTAATNRALWEESENAHQSSEFTAADTPMSCSDTVLDRQLPDAKENQQIASLLEELCTLVEMVCVAERTEAQNKQSGTAVSSIASTSNTNATSYQLDVIHVSNSRAVKIFVLHNVETDGNGTTENPEDYEFQTSDLLDAADAESIDMTTEPTEHIEQGVVDFTQCDEEDPAQRVVSILTQSLLSILASDPCKGWALLRKVMDTVADHLCAVDGVTTALPLETEDSDAHSSSGRAANTSQQLIEWHPTTSIPHTPHTPPCSNATKPTSSVSTANSTDSMGSLYTLNETDGRTGSGNQPSGVVRSVSVELDDLLQGSRSSGTANDPANAAGGTVAVLKQPKKRGAAQISRDIVGAADHHFQLFETADTAVQGQVKRRRGRPPKSATPSPQTGVGTSLYHKKPIKRKRSELETCDPVSLFETPPFNTHQRCATGGSYQPSGGVLRSVSADLDDLLVASSDISGGSGRKDSANPAGVAVGPKKHDSVQIRKENVSGADGHSAPSSQVAMAEESGVSVSTAASAAVQGAVKKKRGRPPKSATPSPQSDAADSPSYKPAKRAYTKRKRHEPETDGSVSLLVEVQQAQSPLQRDEGKRVSRKPVKLTLDLTTPARKFSEIKA